MLNTPMWILIDVFMIIGFIKDEYITFFCRQPAEQVKM